MRSWFASALALSASAGAIVAAQEAAVNQAWAQQPAQPQRPGVIARVVVEGNTRIEKRTIESYLLLRPGDPFDENRAHLSQEALFATGLFGDVVIQQRGTDLVVRAVENAIINRVTFEGNNAVTKKRLEEETEDKPRDHFTLTRAE